jgi:hypothetical protein
MMFVLITLIACYLGYHANIVHRRHRAVHQFHDRQSVQFSQEGGRPVQIPWVRRLMGDESVQAIYLHRYSGGVTAEDEELLKRTFPEAVVSEVYMIPAVPAE